MSGDVQPRKRKDKKKKKEDVVEDVIYHQTTAMPSDDTNIHLHKETSTGGGLCAKCLFFILLILLGALIGLIISEHHGVTDLDSLNTESRFAQLFEGWVDGSQADHEDSEEFTLDDEDDGVQRIDESEEEDLEDDIGDDEEEKTTEEVETDEETDEEEQDTTENESQLYESENVNEYEEDVDEQIEDEDDIDEDLEEGEEEEEEEEEEEQEESTNERDDVSSFREDGGDVDDEDKQILINARTKKYISILKSEEVIEESVENNYVTESEDSEENTKFDQEYKDDDTVKQTIVRVHSKKISIIENAEQKQESPTFSDDDSHETETYNSIRIPSEVMTEDTDSENERMNKQRSGAQAIYDFENITNGDDYKISNELDKAQQNLENDAAYALTLFNKILQKYPNSPRALYGKARSLDILAEKKRSNKQLEQAISAYQQVLKVKNIPDALFQIAAQRCIDRIRFRGLYSQSIPIHTLLIDRFPKEVKFRNHLAITYLTINKINEASLILEEILRNWPEDGVALVHYGFILKTSTNKLKESVDFLKKGIATKQEGVIDGRFYFHLGDALTRLGRKEEAMSVYADGVINKVFLSKYQRSLYNVNRLTGKPWWKIAETQHASLFQNLKNKWTAIRDEGLRLLNKKGFFQPEAENLRDVGEWKQFELYARGTRNNKNCQQCPTTCKLVETIPDAIGCRRGQIKFSVMHPGTHVWPHCGPTNCRLRAHLGLKVPKNTFIRVGEEIRSWKEGKFILFDDSFEHEVWHNGTDTRLVLIIDIWHPELSNHEKLTLSTI